MAVSQEEKNLYPFEHLGFVQSGTRGAEVYGDCIFCGGRKKLHVNTETQKWSCKAGACGRSGNVTTWLEEYHAMCLEQCEEAEPDWDALEEDRGIPVQALQEAQVTWNGEEWVLPEFSSNGRIANLRFYRIGSKSKVKLPCIKGLDTVLYGAEELGDETKRRYPAWLAEGHWDRIALKCMLKKAKKRGVVVAVPGAETFKPAWAEMLQGRDVITTYDYDSAGFKGTKRAHGRLSGFAKSLQWVKWPDTLPDGFDVRDFYRFDGDFDNFSELVTDYEPGEGETYGTPGEVVATFPLLAEGTRPTIEETIEVYRQHLRMTPDMIAALRVIYAVVITIQLPGDPLWVHICSPPGGSKTELLLSCSAVVNTVTASTITVHSLVSGYAGSKDPSLIPDLIGKTFLLKDWTEVLNMPQAQRYEVYSVFRGAYDGQTEKVFGNGIKRKYAGYFNMASGVTPAIYRESSTVLGERFLIYHMNEHNADYSAVVRAALDAVGKELVMKEALKDAAKRFLEYRVELSDIPAIPGEFTERLVNLAQLVAMLRANVERDFMRQQVLYRPQHEVGTRLVKQLAKLLIGLGLQNSPPSIGEEEFAIVQRVAMNSCIGWNIDTLRQLAQYDGLTLDELVERAKVPKTTLRERLKDLVLLGVVREQKDEGIRTVGRRPNRYFVNPLVRQFWEGSGLEISPDRTNNGSHRGNKPAPTIKRKKR